MPITIGRDNATVDAEQVETFQRMLSAGSYVGVLPSGEKFTTIGYYCGATAGNVDVAIYDITGGVAGATLLTSATFDNQGGASGTRLTQAISPVGTPGNTYAVAIKGTSTGGIFMSGGYEENVTSRNGTGYASEFEASWTDNGDTFYSHTGFALSTATGPTVTQTDTTPEDGIQQTINTSGLTGPITAASVGGKSILSLLSGTDPTVAITYTLDIFNGTTTGTSPRFKEPTNLSITATGGAPTQSLTWQPATGDDVITLAGTLEKSAGQFLPAVDAALGVTTVVTDQIYYATADGTSITATGVLTSDASSIQMWLLQGGDQDTEATATPFVVTFGAVTGSDIAVPIVSRGIAATPITATAI